MGSSLTTASDKQYVGKSSLCLDGSGRGKVLEEIVTKIQNQNKWNEEVQSCRFIKIAWNAPV